MRPSAESDMLPFSAARRLARASARILLRRRSANLRCIHVRGDTEPDQHVGCRGWPAGRRAPGSRLGRRALPPPGEEPAQALAAGTARRLALDEALAELDSGRTTPSSSWKVRFGAHARARARSLVEASDHRVRHRAATPSDRRARRDADGADRCESALSAEYENGNGNGNGATPSVEPSSPTRTTSWASPRTSDEELAAELRG